MSVAMNRAQTEVHALLACIECGREWTNPTERWRLKVTEEDPVETVPYCACCATREFGPARRHAARTQL